MPARIFSRSALASLTALLASACTITTVSTGPDGSPATSSPTIDAGLSAESSVDAGSAVDVLVSPGDEAASEASASGEASVVGAPGDAAVTGNGCSDPPANDQTPATASALMVNTSVRACLRSGSDVNYYQYTVPASPPKGGYVIVKVSDVGLQGTIDMSTQTASDSAELVHGYDTTPGGGVVHYFAAKPGATFRAAIKNWVAPPAAAPQTPYTLTVSFTGVNDPSAPNGTVAAAATLVAGTSVQGFFFAGHDSAAAPPASAWESWYKVALTPGTATVALTNVPGDAAGQADLFDANTMPIGGAHYNTVAGANVQYDAPLTAAGTYYVRVQPWSHSATTGTTPSVPTWMTQPWSLTVSVR